MPTSLIRVDNKEVIAVLEAFHDRREQNSNREAERSKHASFMSYNNSLLTKLKLRKKLTLEEFSKGKIFKAKCYDIFHYEYIELLNCARSNENGSMLIDTYLWNGFVTKYKN